MSFVAVESNGPRLVPASSAQKTIEPIPRKYSNFMVSHDTKTGGKSAETYYRVPEVKAIDTLSIPLVCRAMDSAIAAGEVLSSTNIQTHG